ncbi:MAG TPA: TlpA disulfide reductase family protein [Gaiellaceae bacterium]|nr:TlpA disulfide reductase family protein [Gaiellaceae bacterium]
MRSRPAQIASVALVGFLLVLLAMRVISGDRATALAADVAAGKDPAAPTFALPRLDGAGDVSLAALRGRVVLLNFWASWCVPCKQEARVLEQAWHRWRERGVVFVGVDAQDFTADARRFVDHHGVTYANVHDRAGATASSYGVSGFPETWFVDRRGRLVEHVSGPISTGRLDRDLLLALAR